MANRRLAALAAVLALGGAVAAGAARVAFLDLEAGVPDGWEREPPASAMRQLQYRIAGDTPEADARFVVYYFGRGQGGSVQANIARWRGQFSAPDGGAVTPQVERLEVAGMPLTVASFSGRYARGIGTGPQDEARPEQSLVAAVLERPDGPVIFQLYGPSQTVAAARPAYLEMLRSLRRPDASAGGR